MKRSAPHGGEPGTAPADSTSLAQARDLAIAIARTLSDDRCEDVLVLDVTGLSQVCDFIVIGSGTSDRQMKTCAEDVAGLSEERGMPVFRLNEDVRTTWIVLDSLDVVTHVFEPNTRSHYDLELLWGDAPRVDWERPGVDGKDRAGLERSR